MDTYTQNNGACGQEPRQEPGQDLEPGRWAREAGRLPTGLPPPPRLLAHMGVDLCSCIDLGLAHEPGVVGWAAVPCACLPSCLLVPCTPSLQLHYIRAVWQRERERGPRERGRRRGAACRSAGLAGAEGGVALTGLRLRKKLTSASALRSTRTIAHARGADIQPPSDT